MKNKILLLGDRMGGDFYITQLLHCSHKSQVTTHQNSVTISAMQVETFSHFLEQNCIICYQRTLCLILNICQWSYILYDLLRRTKRLLVKYRHLRKHSYCNQRTFYLALLYKHTFIHHVIPLISVELVTPRMRRKRKQQFTKEKQR